MVSITENKGDKMELRKSYFLPSSQISRFRQLAKTFHNDIDSYFKMDSLEEFAEMRKKNTRLTAWYDLLSQIMFWNLDIMGMNIEK